MCRQDRTVYTSFLHKSSHPHTSSTVPLGHILTKIELQVLSGLLDAYSNEKIKEIQQSIRKKQGGDISREEVERSLRKGGLTTIADELEQSLLKGRFSQLYTIKLLTLGPPTPTASSTYCLPHNMFESTDI